MIRWTGRIALLLVWVVLGSGLCLAEPKPKKGTIRVRVMTFNVLCSFCNPKEYGKWEERLAYLADIFARHDADLLGIQELVNAREVEQLRELMGDYEAIHFRKGTLVYPDSTIYFRKSRFEAVESGVYWLSPTPERPMSTGFAKGWQLPRCAVWAMLKERATGRKLLFVTTHFDNNTPSQERSAPLFMERTARLGADVPVIVTGDFNSKPGSPAYAILVSPAANGFRLKNTYDLAQEKRTITNQRPAPPYAPGSRIDHIFVGGEGEWRVTGWRADLTVYGQEKRYPSDHRPIVADVEF